MSKEFIEAQINISSINKAVRQEKQLSYFTSSKLQEDRVDVEYIREWAERKTQSSDYFLNWVKKIFKTENFLLFTTYLRYPLPSTKIIKNRIEPQLQRVFRAEDSDFKYDISNVDQSDFIDILKPGKINKDLFQRILYKHNSLIVSELENNQFNMPYRYFVDIKDVVSLDYSKDKITRIAYTATLTKDDVTLYGYMYIDKNKYAFFDNDRELIDEAEHDLGYCPVHFISPNLIDFDFIVRESLFTYIRIDLEEYTFLKTIQKLTEPNGAIPTVTKIEADDDESDDNKAQGEPGSINLMGGQKPELFSNNKSIATSDLQVGTVYDIPYHSLKDSDGKINMALVEKYINFHYIPAPQLEYLDKRIKDIEKSIISTIVGDFLESNESSKNELQIEKSISALENTLGSLSKSLGTIRDLSDYDILSLRYGKERVNEIFNHFGTDFFLESTTKLLEDFEKSPNPLERKNVIVRINKNRYKNNPDKYIRTEILYNLIPYSSDKDFQNALDNERIDDINFEYYIRFNYWISHFEALYGDIVEFFKNQDTEKSKKYVLINNLIINLIKNQNGSSKQNQDGDTSESS